ncbi:hybrid sensor histidine kinase/response regulator [Azohydromonas caseinilytica]|uniref:histidine kinase n=1 Tax=Azohydromonas caseinilytica TaxID=2728836 RepID=A0A848F646_9BURK|nr:ATP-binding protein [Azohydromonas caseinilytica]NML13760.1 response regulator [Azohydromonas caseinilytica]
MWRSSLRRKLLSVMLLTTLVAVVVALGAMIGYDLRAYHQSWVDDVTAQAELVGSASAAALSFDDPRVAGENLALLRLQPKVRAAAIYTARGRLFASYGADPGPARVPAAPQPGGARVEGSELLVFAPIRDDGQLVGTVFVRARYELYDRLLNYTSIAAGVTLIAMLVALLLSARLQRLVTAPVLEIADVAQDVVRQRDYTRRARRLSDDEIGALAQAFNEMLAEIEQRTRALEASNRDKAREVEERRSAQQEVMRLNQELEQRVQERTAQLEASNRELAAASAAAQQANRAKSEFLSSMSHELRTPLNAIIGFGQLLAADTGAPPERLKLFTEHIVGAGRHLLSLINEILNLAQIEAGRVSLSLEPVRLDEVLAECRTMIEPLATRRGITLHFPESGGEAVMADRTRLKQVLLNLLSNAVKYNRDGGTVRVACAHANAALRISVHDTGAGLRPEQLQLLFQPFNRLGQEGGSQEGTGIGLVVTKRLVELMAGHIGVHSVPGQGSEFWVELPLAQLQSLPTPQQPAQAAGAAPANAQLATVLCVEDNPTNLQLVEAILAARPELRLLTARDGETGVALARAHKPQVILMDNHMPGMSGHEAQALLHQDPATTHIPVIALTADAMPEAVEQGLARGYFRYLTKPVDPAELLAAVDAALEHGRRPERV